MIFHLNIILILAHLHHIILIRLQSWWWWPSSHKRGSIHRLDRFRNVCFEKGGKPMVEKSWQVLSSCGWNENHSFLLSTNKLQQSRIRGSQVNMITVMISLSTKTDTVYYIYYQMSIILQFQNNHNRKTSAIFLFLRGVACWCAMDDIWCCSSARVWDCLAKSSCMDCCTFRVSSLSITAISMSTHPPWVSHDGCVGRLPATASFLEDSWPSVSPGMKIQAHVRWNDTSTLRQFELQLRGLVSVNNNHFCDFCDQYTTPHEITGDQL